TMTSRRGARSWPAGSGTGTSPRCSRSWAGTAARSCSSGRSGEGPARSQAAASAAAPAASVLRAALVGDGVEAVEAVAIEVDPAADARDQAVAGVLPEGP